MKYFKLGLLAATLTLTALIVILDKKEDKKESLKETKDGEEGTIVISDEITL